MYSLCWLLGGIMYSLLVARGIVYSLLVARGYCVLSVGC